jgi:hypothetical protein
LVPVSPLPTARGSYRPYRWTERPTLLYSSMLQQPYGAKPTTSSHLSFRFFDKHGSKIYTALNNFKIISKFCMTLLHLFLFMCGIYGTSTKIYILFYCCNFTFENIAEFTQCSIYTGFLLRILRFHSGSLLMSVLLLSLCTVLIWAVFPVF